MVIVCCPFSVTIQIVDAMDICVQGPKWRHMKLFLCVICCITIQKYIVLVHTLRNDPWHYPTFFAYQVKKKWKTHQLKFIFPYKILLEVYIFVNILKNTRIEHFTFISGHTKYLLCVKNAHDLQQHPHQFCRSVVPKIFRYYTNRLFTFYYWMVPKGFLHQEPQNVNIYIFTFTFREYVPTLV